MTDRRWAWVEVDTSAIRHNVEVLRALIPETTLFMAVVKADGYGHGACAVASAAIDAGAHRLGVATVDEAVALRLAGVTAPLQLLSEPPISSIPLLIEHDIIPATYTQEFVTALDESGRACGQRLRCHLKVDTGMRRIGVPWSETVEFLTACAGAGNVAFEGTFMHFATADDLADGFADTQLTRFTDTLSEMRAAGFDPGIVHAANSPATVLIPAAHFDMVRVGIALYGLEPATGTLDRVGLRPAMSVRARATMVKEVTAGESVSYGRTWFAPEPTLVATLPLGYADGVHRVLSNHMTALIDGVEAPQVGRVCMDQLMVAVPPGLVPAVGAEFTIVGRQGSASISMESLAEKAGTINYEMACAFGSRMERLVLS